MLQKFSQKKKWLITCYANLSSVDIEVDLPPLLGCVEGGLVSPPTLLWRPVMEFPARLTGIFKDLALSEKLQQV